LEGHMGPDHADVRKSSQEGFLLLLFYLFWLHLIATEIHSRFSR
jgi:hypothetical protein